VTMDVRKMAVPIVFFQKMDLLRRIVDVPRCRRVAGAVTGAGASAVADAGTSASVVADVGAVVVAVVDV